MSNNSKVSNSYVRQSSLSLVVLSCAIVLTGCGGGGGGKSATASTATTTTTTTTSTTTPPPVTTTPPVEQTPPPVQQTPPPVQQTPPPVAQNRAPTISGAPLQAVNAASSYAFTPSASDADNDMLGFSIANKPAWANFDTATGRLSGTPTLADVGSYAGVVISVSDGTTSQSLPAFTIAVTQSANGNALLSWTPPTQSSDGSQLTGLSGYKIYYGTSPNALTQSVEIGNGLSSYMVANLSPATWYFRMTAVANGVESDLSQLASKTIS